MPDNYLEDLIEDDYPSDDTMFVNAVNSSQHFPDDFTTLSGEQSNFLDFEKSICIVEFSIQSSIYTREYKPKQVKAKKKNQIDFGESKIVYSLFIGDNLLKWWNSDEDAGE